MNVSKLITDFFSVNPDIFPILEKMREKYDIIEVPKGDDELTDYVLHHQGLDWDVIRQEIYEEVKEKLPVVEGKALKFFKDIEAAETEFDEPSIIQGRDDIPDDIRDLLIEQHKINLQIPKAIKPIIEEYYQMMADRIIDTLTKGEAEELPFYWFGGAFTLPLPDNPMVIAYANLTTEHKWIKEQFSSELKRTFGKGFKVTKGDLNTAPYLAMKHEDEKDKDIADEFIQQHRSQFPKDVNSEKYKARKKQVEDMLKKSNKRLQKKVNRQFGDKN